MNALSGLEFLRMCNLFYHRMRRAQQNESKSPLDNLDSVVAEMVKPDNVNDFMGLLQFHHLIPQILRWVITKPRIMEFLFTERPDLIDEYIVYGTF